MINEKIAAIAAETEAILSEKGYVGIYEIELLVENRILAKESLQSIASALGLKSYTGFLDAIVGRVISKLSHRDQYSICNYTLRIGIVSKDYPGRSIIRELEGIWDVKFDRVESFDGR